MTNAWEQALATVTKPADLKIRGRQRQGYLPEARGYTTWFEYQVVEGRRVIWRAEAKYQAEEFIAAARGNAK